MVIDDLLATLSQQGLEVQGYTDDMVIFIRKKFEEIRSECLQAALNIVQFRRSVGLKVNPVKTNIVVFNKKWNQRKLKKLLG